MKKITLLFLILLLFSNVSCKNNVQSTSTEKLREVNEYAIADNGDLHINTGDQVIILEINALHDGVILEDEHQRLLILSDPSDHYHHGVLGDKLEAKSVTIVELSNEPTVASKFSVPEEWVIESILPIWTDWDEDGIREIVLTLSNSIEGAKLVLYDENGMILAESASIGQGNRWRHALDIDAFGETGQKLLVDVKTPHIGGLVSFYSWDKDNKILKREASLSGYSTHDIGSRSMLMYALLIDEKTEQALLILPSQSKRELAALRYASGEVIEEWRIPLGGKLSGNLELIDDNGVRMIRAVIDNNREVLLTIPE